MCKPDLVKARAQASQGEQTLTHHWTMINGTPEQDTHCHWYTWNSLLCFLHKAKKHTHVDHSFAAPQLPERGEGIHKSSQSFPRTFPNLYLRVVECMISYGLFGSTPRESRILPFLEGRRKGHLCSLRGSCLFCIQANKIRQLSTDAWDLSKCLRTGPH